MDGAGAVTTGELLAEKRMPGSFAGGIMVAAGLLGGLVLAMEVGYWLGIRAEKKSEGVAEQQILAIEAALLGLLGLLLGFSFAGASSRFLERQDQIVQESNAIGTAYLRADLLDEPHGSALKKTLVAYVKHRIETSRKVYSGLSPQAEREIAEFHQKMWMAARDGVKAKPETMRVVLDPVNEVIDLHSTRLAASRKHLPGLVVVLLLLCSGLGMGVIGYGCGICGRRNLVMAFALAVLIAAALWTTIDMDNPRAGLIQLSDKPLEDLRLE